VRVYIAGPMSGLPDFNEAEELLRAHGIDAVNPARVYDAEPKDWKGYMVQSLTDVASCDGLALLPGWERNCGAQLEVRVAFSLDLDVRALDAWLSERAA
jgi:hypothetical protein